MRYHVKGNGQIDLTQRDFIAKGGEGSIYGKGDTIYKVYENPKDMIPAAKVKELRALSDPRILKPKEFLLDSGKRTVGFTMDWIRDTVDLCRLFTNGFRKRNNFSDPIQLIRNMRDVISGIHASNCLMVDGNEFNYLVDGRTLSVPYFIDVNSYQTPSFPATAIMSSIRDPNTHKHVFSEESDWFSFAIVCCQLFVGIHPFRGRHPVFKKNDMDRRMRERVSIFNKEVEVPPMARDIGLIPFDYLEWFVALFEKGERSRPPLLIGAVVAVPFKVIPAKGGTDNFVIDLIREYDSEILFYGAKAVKTEKKLYFGKKEYDNVAGVEVVFTPVLSTPVLVRIENGRLKLGSPSAEMGRLDVECTDKMIVGNTLYVRNEGNLIEIAFNNMKGDKVVPSIKAVWDIMPHSSEMFSGVVYQNVLGRQYLGIPVPATEGLGSFMEMEIQELQEYKIVEAKHENRICMVVGHKEGRYDRLVLRFDKEYKTYDCRVIGDVDYAAINFVVLDNGIAVSMNEDGVMEIFSNNVQNREIRTVADSEVDGTMRLCRDGAKLMFFQGNKLYRIRMK